MILSHDGWAVSELEVSVSPQQLLAPIQFDFVTAHTLYDNASTVELIFVDTSNKRHCCVTVKTPHKEKFLFDRALRRSIMRAVAEDALSKMWPLSQNEELTISALITSWGAKVNDVFWKHSLPASCIVVPEVIPGP